VALYIGNAAYVYGQLSMYGLLWFAP